jgi:hypothetical protein
LHFQQGEGLGQCVAIREHRLIGHGLVLGQAQARFLATHHRHRPAIEALALAQHFPRLFQRSARRLRSARLATAAALEQADAQVAFQQGDGLLTADCALRCSAPRRKTKVARRR